MKIQNSKTYEKISETKYTHQQNILKANAPVLNVINEGYKIRLTDIPKPATFKNNHFEMYHSTFDAVSALLKSGGIREVETLVHVIKPLPM